MSEAKKGSIEALTGKAAAANVDWKTKYEEAQHALDVARVEQGRVKKLSEENEALRRRVKDAESRRADDGLSEEERATIDDAQRGVIGKMVDTRLEAAGSALGSEIASLREQIAERDKAEAEARRRNFAERVEREHPGFLEAISEGGDKYAAWQSYCRFNSASISGAVDACDFDMLEYHIGKFYRDELGVEVPPSGGAGAAAPDPRNIGGGAPAARRDGKSYTLEEISDLYDEVEKARDRGDFAEVKRLGDIIEKAMREGRVVK